MKVKSKLIDGGFYMHTMNDGTRGERLVALCISPLSVKEIQESLYSPFVGATSARALEKAFKKLAEKLEAEAAEEDEGGSPV